MAGLTKQAVDELMLSVSAKGSSPTYVMYLGPGGYDYRAPTFSRLFALMRGRPAKRTARKYWWNGSLYLIRDRRDAAGKFTGCEYAVRNPNGTKRWLTCAEGVDFADIAPLRSRRLDG